MDRMDLVAAIPLLAMRTLRMGRFPPRALTYSSTVWVVPEELDEAVVSSRVAAQREVEVATSLFGKKALLSAPKMLRLVEEVRA